tara:strand:+ start:232 stop:762 length:531 start_codon:yes stop_codon:yes gene_type:complete
MRCRFVLLFLFFLSCLPSSIKAKDSSHLVLGFGAFDMNDNKTTGEQRIEYRHGERYLSLFKPFVGIMRTNDEAYYGYLGIGIDLYFGKCRCVVFQPNFAVGIFEDGDDQGEGPNSGKDLGGGLEFRSGVELAYRFENNMRFGIAFSHISNAGLGDINPGTESLVLTWAVPLDWLEF